MFTLKENGENINFCEGFYFLQSIQEEPRKHAEILIKNRNIAMKTCESFITI